MKTDWYIVITFIGSYPTGCSGLDHLIAFVVNCLVVLLQI